MTIPQCGAVRTGQGDRIALTGFDAVDAWAKENDGVWRSLSRLAEIHQWGEVDRLRLIAATFLHERARMKTEAEKEPIKKDRWVDIVRLHESIETEQGFRR